MSFFFFYSVHIVWAQDPLVAGWFGSGKPTSSTLKAAFPPPGLVLPSIGFCPETRLLSCQSRFMALNQQLSLSVSV